MRTLVPVTLALLLVPAVARAQQPTDPFGGINSTGAAVTPPTATSGNTAPTAQNAPSGPAAPYGAYGYYGRQWTSPFNYGNYYYYQQVSRQYNQTMDNLFYMERNWPLNSPYRQSIEAFRNQGREIFERYRRYQDSGSLYQLQYWMSEAQSYLSSYGYSGYSNGYPYNYNNWNTYPYNNGNYSWWGSGGCYGTGYGNSGYYGQGYGCGGTYGGGCDVYGNCSSLPNYGYYDVYPQLYYGGYAGVNDPTFHAMGVGDGISNIIYGSQYGNNLQLIGGILGTAGNVLNLTNDSRGYYGYRY